MALVMIVEEGIRFIGRDHTYYRIVEAARRDFTARGLEWTQGYLNGVGLFTRLGLRPECAVYDGAKIALAQLEEGIVGNMEVREFYS